LITGTFYHRRGIVYISYRITRIRIAPIYSTHRLIIKMTIEVSISPHSPYFRSTPSSIQPPIINHFSHFHNVYLFTYQSDQAPTNNPYNPSKISTLHHYPVTKVYISILSSESLHSLILLAFFRSNLILPQINQYSNIISYQ
jgi:hypothetical protein